MFPVGLPGLALLLLRASVATPILLESYNHPPGLSGWVLVALALLCLALSVGFLTPIAAVLALIFQLLSWPISAGNGAGMACIAILDALALALIGPGAYSIDARRFGRRMVVLPPE
jgi:uncharacterized membrane protein YphA (DoxX/SURF4 family)